MREIRSGTRSRQSKGEPASISGRDHGAAQTNPAERMYGRKSCPLQTVSGSRTPADAAR